ncbi:RNase H domain-containing protein [Trichonephila clavipes]|nr:RNase H domain-containing protein [Trichonephila clavipes]
MRGRVDSDDVQELLDFLNQELTIDELIEMHEQEQDIEELEPLDQSEDRMKFGNFIEGLSLIEKGLHVKELLDFLNQELTIDELTEMHEQEQDIEELEPLDPVQSEDRKKVGHTGIYGNERADWLAKEATKLRDLVPMSIPKSYHKKVFKEKIISEWNNLYQISINAHLTKEFFPSIQSRLKAKHFHPNFKLTQFLTGHGNFKAYLKRFNLSLTDQCSCSSDSIKMPSM